MFWCFSRREDRTYILYDVLFGKSGKEVRMPLSSCKFREELAESAHGKVIWCFVRAGEERTSHIRGLLLEKRRRSAHGLGRIGFWKKEESFCDARKGVRKVVEGFIYASPVQASWCARPK